MDDMNCTKNEDDLEEAEMRLLQRQLDQGQHVTESQEEKDYKAEFFELLDEVCVTPQGYIYDQELVLGSIHPDWYLPIGFENIFDRKHV